MTYERVLKSDYVVKVREDAEEEYKAKLTLEMNKAKDAYVVAESNLKVYSSRPVMDNLTIWLSEIKQMENAVEKMRTEYKTKQELLANYQTSSDFQRHMRTYQLTHRPTENDYETVKMANQYGIVEAD